MVRDIPQTKGTWVRSTQLMDDPFGELFSASEKLFHITIFHGWELDLSQVGV